MSIEIRINRRGSQGYGMMKRYNVSISEELDREIEKERKKRYIETVPEMMRILLSEHMAEKKADQ